MRAAALLLVCACSEPGWIRRPQYSPRDFCHALARLNLEDATWVMASKLDSIGGRGNEQSRDIVRAWLFRQPCVLDVRPPCFDSMHPELRAFIRLRTVASDDAAIGHTGTASPLRIRVRLYRSGGATVSHSEACPGDFDEIVPSFDALLQDAGVTANPGGL